jgi:hypothetical protein
MIVPQSGRILNAPLGKMWRTERGCLLAGRRRRKGAAMLDRVGMAANERRI